MAEAVKQVHHELDHLVLDFPEIFLEIFMCTQLLGRV